MAKKKKSNRIFASSSNDSEVILYAYYRVLFSSLLEKSLDLCRRFYTEYEPACLYDVDDVDYVLSQLQSDRPTDIGSLAERISGFCIDDAIVVMDSIRRRMYHLREETDTMQISRNDAVELILDCVRSFRDELAGLQGQSDDCESTR